MKLQPLLCDTYFSRNMFDYSNLGVNFPHRLGSLDHWRELWSVNPRLRERSPSPSDEEFDLIIPDDFWAPLVTNGNKNDGSEALRHDHYGYDQDSSSGFEYCGQRKSIPIEHIFTEPTQRSDICSLNNTGRSQHYQLKEQGNKQDRYRNVKIQGHIPKLEMTKSFDRSSSSKSKSDGETKSRKLAFRSDPSDKYILIDDSESEELSTQLKHEGNHGSDNFHDVTENVNCKTSVTSADTRAERDIVSPPNYPAYNVIRQNITEFGGQVDYIRGDGNCFFRALSKTIYGSEWCHEEVRQAVVDFIEKYPKKFEQFVDNCSVQDHVEEMRKVGTWATQTEIYASATLLQRDIYVLSPDHTGNEYRWLLFSPQFSTTNHDYHRCHMTLCHTNGNHYDRIAPPSGNCNCGLKPPSLSGLNIEVDLTDENCVV